MTKEEFSLDKERKEKQWRGRMISHKYSCNVDFTLVLN